MKGKKQDRSYHHQSYMKLFNDRSAIEQELLQLLAVFSIPSTPSELHQHLCALKKSKLVGLGLPVFESILDELTKVDLTERLEDGCYRLKPELIQEMVLKLVWSQRFASVVKSARDAQPLLESAIRFTKGHKCSTADEQKILSDQLIFLNGLRTNIYLGTMNYKEIEAAAIRYGTLYPDDRNRRDPLIRIFDYPFRESWFSHIPDEITAHLHLYMLQEKLGRIQNPERILHSLEGLYKTVTDPDLSDEIYRFLSIFYRLRSRPTGDWLNERHATREIAARREGWSFVMKAFQYLIEGSYSLAMSTFHKAWREIRQDDQLKSLFMGSLVGPCYVLAALHQRKESLNNEQVLILAKNILIPMSLREESAWKTEEIYPIVDQLISPYVPGGSAGSYTLDPTLALRHNTSIKWLFEALFGLWQYGEDYHELLRPLRKIYSRAKQSGYQWLAAEAGTLIAHLDPQDIGLVQESKRLHELLGTQSLIHLRPVRIGWRKLLERLKDIGETKHQLETQLGKSETRRLIWVCQRAPKSDEFSFDPYVQQSHTSRGRHGRRQMKGSWGKSSRVKLKDLYKAHREQAAYLSPQDHRVISQILINGERDRSDWEHCSERDFKFNAQTALKAVVGHPLLFQDVSKGERRGVKVTMEKPRIKIVYPDDRHLSLSVHPTVKELPELGMDESFIMVEQGEQGDFQLIECRGVHYQIASLLDQEVKIPRGEEASLNAVIDQLSNFVEVHADLGEMGDIVEHALADPTPILSLSQTEEGGLKIQLRVQPFAQGGNLLRPGEGGSILSTMMGGRRLRVERDLEDEVQRKQLILDNCPIFNELRTLIDGDWLLEEREQYLELLLQLQTVEGQVKLQVPEGQELHVSKPEVGFSSFKNVSIKRSGNRWFKLDGNLIIDEELQLTLQELIRRERVGRFVVMENGEFVALSEELITMVNELSEVTQDEPQGLCFMENLSVPVMGILGNMNELVSADKHWRRVKSRINEIQAPDQVATPDGLNAELRDYQLEGYRWLYGNAQLGTGVCLADDMGLGKTLQALTLLLARAVHGPSLVIAPTSVAQNWIIEASRFTPDLNVSRFGGPPSQRDRFLKGLKPYDVIVSSYGLLKTEVERLSGVRWNIVVLDEAQNIKNHNTQAAKSAVRLKADFRFVTTGTPIENNLTELWSLFQFLNPHLLKGIKDFKERFLNPIERDNSRDARRKLNRLISPFILRRTKENVLEDLPPLTEITLSINLSPEERQFYAGIKLDELGEIEELMSRGESAGRMRLFALLTKLRQATCHPRLIVPDINMMSSKMNAFESLIKRLKEGGHKVLVFSQFVRHLDLLSETLDRLRIQYQYLTGKTSVAERQRRVDAFQSGEGDVFLISLKAGGVGLNLTAADYVIHMDPWWNPAVEDQASDRAHRIGQERPVTVYRLVGKDTIEEQIVALHQHKRDLADAILEGSERTSFNTDQILELLREEMGGNDYGDLMDDDHVSSYTIRG